MHVQPRAVGDHDLHANLLQVGRTARGAGSTKNLKHVLAATIQGAYRLQRQSENVFEI
jgi:hypothetical protein